MVRKNVMGEEVKDREGAGKRGGKGEREGEEGQGKERSHLPIRSGSSYITLSTVLSLMFVYYCTHT